MKGHGKGRKTTKREAGKPLAPMGQGSMTHDLPKYQDPRFIYIDGKK